MHWLRWATPGFAFGADYNPEQWPREVWDDDVKAMREAGVNIVSLGIFSWAHLQPAADRWDFAWLDEIMDLLHASGIAVDLGTATASPPPWLTRAHPEILPVTADGVILWSGGRQHWRPTSPVFREHALRLVETLATRYRDHPALAAWHVNNELGCHNIHDYSDDAAAAFRVWAKARYQTLDALNHAWGTSFWSQRYGDWDEIIPPRRAASYPNPTLQLDFKRFSSDALKDQLRAERDLLRRVTPDIPVTTNFMVMGDQSGMNYADWAGEIDFVANDHYVTTGQRELLFSANLTGNLTPGRPWFMMEHSTSAVNWQPINRAKRTGELSRDSLSHVAHGADAVCFFQWRASAAGAEKYHSGMVPHAGTDSAVFRAVVELGATLQRLAPVAGSTRRPAPVAILQDWDSWWAAEQDSHPSTRLRYRQEALDWYAALQDLGVRADVVPTTIDWSGYRVVIAPILHVVPPPLAARLTEFVAGGGHLITTYFSGIVDHNDHIVLGGYPGALRDLLGIRVEEFAPLPDGESVDLANGTVGTLWTEPVELTTASALVTYASGDFAGQPAVTRREHPGGGSATYVSTRLGPAGVRPLLRAGLAAAGVTSELPPVAQGRVELTIRRRGDREFWFLINLTDEPVPLDGLAGDALHGDPDTLAPRGVTVLSRQTA